MSMWLIIIYEGEIKMKVTITDYMKDDKNEYFETNDIYGRC
jgi:hypothetical protein